MLYTLQYTCIEFYNLFYVNYHYQLSVMKSLWGFKSNLDSHIIIFFLLINIKKKIEL